MQPIADLDLLDDPADAVAPVSSAPDARTADRPHTSAAMGGRPGQRSVYIETYG